MSNKAGYVIDLSEPGQAAMKERRREVIEGAAGIVVDAKPVE
jgi:hypothetical protein